jgi:predicted nucleic acid-binding protein
MPPVVVSDSSPLIAFERMGQLSLLTAMVGSLWVPPAVRYEVFGPDPLPTWVKERPLAQPLAPRMTASHLGPGEREAIALALEIGAAELLLDDLPARRLAVSLGVPVIGTVGLLLRAKKRNLIVEVRPLIDALHEQGFHTSERLLRGVLEAARERGLADGD